MRCGFSVRKPSPMSKAKSISQRNFNACWLFLLAFKDLKLLSLAECSFSSGTEGKEAFDGIWNFLAMGPCIRSNFELLCWSHEPEH